jgi:hypothetical protein
LRRRRKIAGGVIVAAAGAHPQLFPQRELRFSIVHGQRHLLRSGLDQPVEIDKVAAAHKAHRIEKLA